MILTTESFVQHDQCARLRTYSDRYESLRVSLNYAMNESLYAAFAGNNPAFAAQKIMSLAANPGIDIDSKNLYESVIHHSRLVELIATYALSVGNASIPNHISMNWGEFQPKSFLMTSGNLRRLVLVDRWSKDRENLERFSWRTAADTAITNRPMVITAIVIGGVRAGLRPSVWTQGYEHPANKGIRIQRREGEFNDNWRMVYREQTSLKPVEWLREMQSDGAFDGRVFSFTEDVPRNRQEVLDHLDVMAGEIKSGSLRQTRSSCFKFKPCPFLPACITTQPPAQMGWVEKTSLIENESAILPVIS